MTSLKAPVGKSDRGCGPPGPSSARPNALDDLVEVVKREVAIALTAHQARLVDELDAIAGLAEGLYQRTEFATAREISTRLRQLLEEKSMTTMRTHTFTGTELAKPLVKSILEHPSEFEWSLQGLGMLRMYLEPELRLHVWDSRFKFDNASTLHTHPWNFRSFIVAGEVNNQRFIESDVGEAIQRQTIRCGVGGGLIGQPETVPLKHGDVEVYGEGESYSQLAHEIHESQPVDGTVTIIRREFTEDTEHAYVYFPVGEEWGTAEPRPATSEEVLAICGNALERWF